MNKPNGFGISFETPWGTITPDKDLLRKLSDKLSDFTGLDLEFPSEEKPVKRAALVPGLEGIDPKLMYWILGGAGGLLLLMMAMRK